MTHIPRSAKGWTPDKLPNPGIDQAFDRGLPVLILDTRGRTQIVRTHTQYNAATAA